MKSCLVDTRLSDLRTKDMLTAHVCFKIKYCHNVFDIVEFKSRCTELLQEAAAIIGVEITELCFERNHVHMDIFWKKTSISLDQISKSLKGRTARKLFKEFPAIKKRFFWASGLWSPMIYGDSMGRNPEQIRNYIRNQGKAAAAYNMSLTQFFNQ